MENVRGTRGIAERTRSRNPIVQEFVPSSAWTEDSNGHYLLVDLPDFKKEEVRLQFDSSGHIIISGERLQVNDNKYVYFEQSFKVPENSDTDKITGKFDGEILYVTIPKHVVEKKEEPEREIENVNHNVEENVHENPNNNRKDDEKHGEKHDHDDHDDHDDEHGHDHDHHDDHGHCYDHENKGQSKKKSHVDMKEKHGDDGHGYHREHKGNREKKSYVDSFHNDFLEKWGKEASQLERAMEILKNNKGIVITAMVAFSLGILVARKFESAGK